MPWRRRSLIGPAAISVARISVPRPNLPPIGRATVGRSAIGRRLITGTRHIVGRRTLLAVTLRPALVLRGLPALTLLAVRLPLLRPRWGRIPGGRRGTSRRTGVLPMKTPRSQCRRSTRDRNRRNQGCAPQTTRIVRPGHHLFPDLFPGCFLSGPTPSTARTSRFSFPQGSAGRTPC